MGFEPRLSERFGAGSASHSQLPAIMGAIRILTHAVHTEQLPPDLVDCLRTAARECDLMIVAGTAGAVQPAASIPFAAGESGARVVDINPEATGISRNADWHLCGPGATWLPALAKALSDTRR